VIFPLISIFNLQRFFHFYSTKQYIKHQEWCSPISISLRQATDHTCTLVEATKINISIMAFLFTKNKINAYKNKYSTFVLKLSLTVSMVQNKPRKLTNTSIPFIDLDLHIYD
jgi:hypothetical protein